MGVFQGGWLARDVANADLSMSCDGRGSWADLVPHLSSPISHHELSRHPVQGMRAATYPEKRVESGNHALENWPRALGAGGSGWRQADREDRDVADGRAEAVRQDRDVGGRRAEAVREVRS